MISLKAPFREGAAFLALYRTDLGRRVSVGLVLMISRTPETKTASFKLVGEWDFASRDELQAMLSSAESADKVLLDFSEVTFIDASVLGNLINLRNRVTARNRLGIVQIVAASQNAARIFEVCQLQTLFGLPESAHAACVVNRQLTSRMQSDAPLATA